MECYTDKYEMMDLGMSTMKSQESIMDSMSQAFAIRDE